jgi:hypothetical protein
MRSNNINSAIANVFTRFGVQAVDMLRTRNASAMPSWRHQLCTTSTSGPLSGRHLRADLLLGDMSVEGKRGNYSIGNYLPAITKPTLQPSTIRPQEQVHNQEMFQRLS